METLLKSNHHYDLRLGTGAEYDPEHLEELKSMGVGTETFDAMRHYNLFTAPIAVLEIASYLRRERIDILHTHSTEAGVIGRIAGRIADTPIIIHEIHGDPITSDRNPLLNTGLLWLEQVCSRCSTVLIAKSKRIRETYLERGVGHPQQYQLIYHGIDVEKFRTASPSNHLQHDGTMLLYVGRLADGKGLEDLLDALGQLQHLDVKLNIAGTGPLRGQLENLVRERQLGDTVSFLGYRDDVPELLTTADALVLPSYREGTPRVVTESLAAGTPVISTRIAGIPEQVTDGETGRLIDPGDVEALVKAIVDLTDNPERWRQMGELAQTRVDKFKLETSNETYHRLYCRLRNERLTD